jgi:hypothetical protein
VRFQNSTGQAEPASPDIAALTARRGSPPPVAPADAHSSSPLSDAVLARRIPLAREENPVVHVTVGRIDVVANPAPASPPKRVQDARQGSVALSDYLRGGNGSRR